jgi:uncharacterized membrane protein YphA (DoxX/SURF4 family)
MMFEKKVLNVYSIILGIFFLVSGFGKVIDTTAFGSLIAQYGFHWVMIASPLIVVLEILLGVLLVLVIAPKRTAFVSFILLIIFTAAFAYGHFQNGIDDCGCFGTIRQASTPPWLSFLRNIILIAIALVVWLKYPQQTTDIARWKKFVIVVVMIVSIFEAGYSFRMPSFYSYKKPVHAYQNQLVKNTELAKYARVSPDSTYLYFCFSYTCPHCWNSIENLLLFKRSGTIDRFVALASGKDADKLLFEQNFQPDFPITNLSKEEMDKIVNAYPTAFYVKHDSIKIIIQSELPSPMTFKKQYNIPSSN